MERYLTAALAVGLVSGCASPPPQPQLVDQRQYAKAVRDSSSAFTWPDGRKPDLDVLAEKSGPGPDKAGDGAQAADYVTSNCESVVWQ